MKKITVLLLVLLLNSSCNISLHYTPSTIKELLLPGSQLQLTRPLEIPANRSFVYIANGKVPPLTNFNPVNIYLPYCMFRLAKEKPYARHVLPDKFLVTKVVEWEGYFGSLDYRNVRIQQSEESDFIKLGGFVNDDGGPSLIMYATIMSLHSDTQPEVKEMVCGHWNDQGIVEPLTLEELKSALGDLITIHRGARVITGKVSGLI